jgi:hypothetical protein
MNTPGPHVDSMIARKVWRAIVITDTASGENYMVNQDDQSRVSIPAFSTDFDEAQKVVEFFQAKGWSFRLQSVPETNEFRGCFFRDDGQTYRFMKAATVPMTICESALAALNGTNIIR